MLKVIFIDDESATLKLLSKIIQWEDEGFIIKGTATDGNEGLDLYERVRPDLIIVDVVMPVMDGIEFIRRVRERDAKVKIIILSAYSEFEYAQKAISFEICDYILKPLDENKLLVLVRSLSKSINSERLTAEGYKRLKSKLDHFKYAPVLKRLASFTSNEEYPDNSYEELNDIFLLPGFKKYCTAYVKVMKLADSHQEEAFLKSVSERFIKNLDSVSLSFDWIAAEIDSSTCVVICGLEGLGIIPQPEAVPDLLFTSELCRILQAEGINYKAGFSSIFNEALNIQPSIIQAYYAYGICFYSKDTETAFYTSDLAYEMFEEKLLARKEELLTRLVQSTDRSGMSDFIRNLFQAFYDKCINPEAVYIVCFNLLLIVKIKVMHMYSNSAFYILRKVTYEQIRSFFSCKTLEIFMLQLLDKAIMDVRKIIEEGKSYSIITKAKEYGIANFLRKDLSIQNVADFVGLSKSHFTKIFKEATGENYWDFISRLRIEEAKKLLKDTNKTNFEICSLIGYESEFHFSRKFKEINGITPMQYRRL